AHRIGTIAPLARRHRVGLYGRSMRLPRSLTAALIACFALGSSASGAELVARGGDPATGLPGTTYQYFVPLVFGGEQTLYFMATTLDGGSGGSSAMYRWSSGAGTTLLFAKPGGFGYLGFLPAAANRSGDALLTELELSPQCPGAVIPTSETLWKREATGT